MMVLVLLLDGGRYWWINMIELNCDGSMPSRSPSNAMAMLAEEQMGQDASALAGPC